MLGYGLDPYGTSPYGSLPPETSSAGSWASARAALCDTESIYRLPASLGGSPPPRSTLPAWAWDSLKAQEAGSG